MKLKVYNNNYNYNYNNNNNFYNVNVSQPVVRWNPIFWGHSFKIYDPTMGMLTVVYGMLRYYVIINRIYQEYDDEKNSNVLNLMYFYSISFDLPYIISLEKEMKLLLHRILEKYFEYLIMREKKLNQIQNNLEYGIIYSSLSTGFEDVQNLLIANTNNIGGC